MSTGMTDAIGVVLVVVLGLTATVDFMRHPRALEHTGRLRIPPRAVPVLGAIKALAALGLVLSVDMRLKELTGACLVIYFAVAVLTHIRAKQRLVSALPAAALAMLSAVYLVGLIAQ